MSETATKLQAFFAKYGTTTPSIIIKHLADRNQLLTRDPRQEVAQELATDLQELLEAVWDGLYAHLLNR